MFSVDLSTMYSLNIERPKSPLSFCSLLTHCNTSHLLKKATAVYILESSILASPQNEDTGEWCRARGERREGQAGRRGAGGGKAPLAGDSAHGHVTARDDPDGRLYSTDQGNYKQRLALLPRGAGESGHSGRPVDGGGGGAVDLWGLGTCGLVDVELLRSCAAPVRAATAAGGRGAVDLWVGGTCGLVDV